MRPWWEAWPGRVEHEYQCLDAAGVRYARDEAPWAAGYLQLDVTEIGGKPVDLVVTFPDLFPFFRPLVRQRAGADGLTHHVAPSGDLCLLGRRSEAWSPGDTLAWLLTEQLPKTLAAGAPRDEHSDTEALDTLEEHQAEPVTEYYSCSADDAMILVDGDWTIPAEARTGQLRLRFRQIRPQVADGTLGAVVSVHDDDTTELAVFDLPAAEHFPHEVEGRWVRLGAAVQDDDPSAIFSAAQAALAAAGDRSPGRWTRLPSTTDRQFQVLGVLFPEERAHRTSGDGWLFVVRVQHDARPGKPPKNKRGARPVGLQREANETHIVRAGYAGRSDMSARVPELRGLAGKHVAVIGLGTLGGTVAEQLARAGVGGLTLLDRDRIEPGNLVRHAAWLPHVGWSKAAALMDIVSNTGPHTKPQAARSFLGGPRADGDTELQQDFLNDLLRRADLVVDCTAEKGVHRFLSWLCSRRQKDLLVVSASPGGWGGRTVRLPARVGGACWNCVEHHLLDDGGSPLEMPGAPDQDVQPAGCADPTFTGAGFDMAEIALHAVRVAVGMLLRDEPGGYPQTDEDVHVLALRTSSGAAVPPSWTAHQLAVHPVCDNSDHPAA